MQGVVQDVRGRVGAADAGPAVGVDVAGEGVADFDFADGDAADVDDDVAVLLGVGDDGLLGGLVLLGEFE